MTRPGDAVAGNSAEARATNTQHGSMTISQETVLDPVRSLKGGDGVPAGGSFSRAADGEGASNGASSNGKTSKFDGTNATTTTETMHASSPRQPKSEAREQDIQQQSATATDNNTALGTVEAMPSRDGSFGSATAPSSQIIASTTTMDGDIDPQQQQPPSILSAEILENPTFNLHNLPSTSSPPSSVASSREPGMDSFRRFVRSRATARTRTTAESSSQRSTQSLGDEDLFALAADGEERSCSDDNVDNQPRRASWDPATLAARIQPSENVPPIVWEEQSSDSAEQQQQQQQQPDNNNRRSEQPPNRLRGFLPAVRRRGGRQSSSVRRHLPGSSNSAGGGAGSMLAASPLSTTAAAVLFTSSQASIDSSNEYAISPSNHLNRLRRQTHPSRMPSASTLDDSAIAVGTSHRSTAFDVGGGDALSISTVGNSTIMARSDPAGLGDSGRQSSTTRTHGGGAPGARGRGGGGDHDVETGNGGNGGRRNNNANDTANGGTTDPNNQADPRREARIRWVRINQRFQLMITFVAILFSLLLFAILISWIVLTSAYVVTFEKSCDVPLKFFYWMVTLQLVLDVFRNDIMRHVLRWNPSSHEMRHQTIPARIVAYNIAYLAYALLVLRLGITCVFVQGQLPESTCRHTAPELFQSSLVFVTLTLAAWTTIILGYLVPFCAVATLLTWNGYSPADDENRTGVFPAAYSTGAPAGTIEQLQELDFNECGESLPQECCICMEDFGPEESIVQTDCGHILHKNCCSVWFRQARTCPVCRTDIPNALAARHNNNQGGGDVEQVADTNHNENSAQQQLQQHEPDPPQRHLQLPNPVPVNQRTPVTPHLPFRPAGRQEVVTLIRALRQPRREQPSGTGRPSNSRSVGMLASRRPSDSQGSRSRQDQLEETNTANSHVVERVEIDHSGGIEITALNQAAAGSATTAARENETSPLPPRDVNDEDEERQV